MIQTQQSSCSNLAQIQLWQQPIVHLVALIGFSVIKLLSPAKLISSWNMACRSVLPSLKLNKSCLTPNAFLRTLNPLIASSNFFLKTSSTNLWKFHHLSCIFRTCSIVGEPLCYHAADLGSIPHGSFFFQKKSLYVICKDLVS